MEQARERTMNMLKGLDDMLSSYNMATSNTKLLKKIEFNLRWINTNLDTKAITEVIDKAYELENSDVMIDLLSQKEFDPKRFN
jgi:hypothetical protein